MDWDDLRAFLAVAQLGSLRRAAEALGVTQPTIARRLRGLEADLGLPLFERERDGHRLTAAGAVLLPEARAVETAALRVERRSHGLVGGLAETLRVGAGEWAAALLARGLAGIAEGPGIELLVTGAPAPGAGRAPEILVRHGIPETGEGLTRRVGALDCALYGAPRFAEGRALPLGPAELASLPWLGFVEEQEHYVTMRWLRERMRERPPAARLMRSDLMAAAAAGGVGVAVLPCFLGDALPGLLRLSAPIEALRADYWAVAHPDLARNPSVRAAVDWILDCFRSADGPQAAAG
ncbi:DNA-binding transcriptional regulator, LysR family [Tistlia consotensis]|uniref:DNA-binding transcriptional regulator, LysR family n=1 Tax=Tistlia consotensis USBA 355 TaxID=560819 RepID=A0A1Y6CA64_9PROT|nr:LysR family transcriptional regulator [Tistlia consotensis]SMF51227.1 DNA-binding transcriptional regulator, LysR family [Tistlia consotensis USBA 355]SNR84649.1 DNA-binding transcriptional regulator, LysR family [Tistlia consotensis]